MTDTAAPADRLQKPVTMVAGMWLVVLPLLRPLIWNGDPTNIANLFYLVMLSAAIATGLVWRAIMPTTLHDTRPWWARAWPWGLLFLLIAALGAWSSPMPAQAWALVCGWSLHIAAPLALLPAIRRYPYLVIAGLMSGLLCEITLMAGQLLWERPHMAAILASDPGLTAEKRVSDQLHVRISSWRLEGTFLLANTLASYLLLLLPLLVSSWWQRWQKKQAHRIFTTICVLLTLIAFVLTGSKAGILSALVAGIVCALLFIRRLSYKLIITGLILVTIFSSLCIPTVREKLVASADVRIDYWTAASQLVLERPISGHGINGFEISYPRVKAPAAEETVVVHQEWLQTAVDLGIPALLVLSIWWVALLRGVWFKPPKVTPQITPAEGIASSPIPVDIRVLTILIMCFAFLQVGVLKDNFSVYPGEMPIVWGILFIIIAMMCVWVCRLLPIPNGISFGFAALALVMHVQAEFSFHSMQVVGVAAWVLCLGLSRQAFLQEQEQPTVAWKTQALPLLGMVLLMAVTAGVIMTAMRGELRSQARQAEAILQRLRLAETGQIDPKQAEYVMRALDYMAGAMVSEDPSLAQTPSPGEAVTRGLLQQLIPASQSFPADSDLAFAAVSIANHFQHLYPTRIKVVTPYLESLASAWPQQIVCLQALADHYLRLAKMHDGDQARTYARQGQAFANQVVDKYPTHLPFRAQLIKAATLTGDSKTVLEQQQEIKRLEKIVHPDNQLPNKP